MQGKGDAKRKGKGPPLHTRWEAMGWDGIRNSLLELNGNLNWPLCLFGCLRVQQRAIGQTERQTASLWSIERRVEARDLLTVSVRCPVQGWLQLLKMLFCCSKLRVRSQWTVLQTFGLHPRDVKNREGGGRETEAEKQGSRERERHRSDT